MKKIAFHILATLTFFTRLPLWRLCNIPREYYERVVPLWPLAGWVTGGVMALVFALSADILPFGVAVMLALASRVLVTGALHEDGFADFCDGFGGGTSRERTLEIMKDSHIGTYGVLGLIIYYLISYNTLSELIPILSEQLPAPPAAAGAVLFLCIDPMAKMLSSTIVWFLPYARKETEAKNRLVYANVTKKERCLTIILGLLPSLVLLPLPLLLPIVAAMLFGALTAAFLFRKMHNTIQGYTGDCCGATFIITELVMYLVFTALL